MSNYSRIILFAFVASVLVNQVFSIQCYTCETVKGGNCDTNPKQRKYETDCDSPQSFSSKSRESDVFSAASMMSNIKFNSTALGNKNLDRMETMDCAKITGQTSLGQRTVARLCTLESISCAEYSDYVYRLNGYRIESCNRCNTNLCNSSDNLKIGIWRFAITAVIALALVM